MNVILAGGHFDSYDGIDSFLVTESMVLRHSAKLYPDSPSLNKLHFDVKDDIANNKAIQTGEPKSQTIVEPPEPIYIWRPLLISAVAVPFYYIAMLFSASPVITVALFTNSLIISFICVVVFCFSLVLYGSRKIAFISSLITGVCSFMWSYITTLEGNPLAALCVISAAYFIYLSINKNSIKNISSIDAHKNGYNRANIGYANRQQIYLYPVLGGLFLGFAFIAHPMSVIVIPGFIGYVVFSMRNNRKSLSTFLIALGTMLIFIAFLNYVRFGSFTEFGYGGYGSLSQHHGWKGLLGLVLSPGKGIIFYFPVIILLPIALRHLYNENKGLFWLIVYTIVIFWLYVGTLSYDEPGSWTGQIGWGPRYLVSTVPFITIAFGALLLHLKNRILLRASIIILSVVSFFISFLGTIVWYQYGLGYGWDRDELWKYDNLTFLKNGSYVAMTWFPEYSPIILHIKVLMSDYLSKVLQIHSTGVDNTQLAYDWAFMGLAPCSYDSYVLCKAGSVPIVLIACLEVGLAISILRQVKVDVVQHAYRREVSHEQHISQEQPPNRLGKISQENRPSTQNLLLDRFNIYRRGNLDRSRLAKYYSLIISISVSDLKLRYKNSFLGFVWTFLQPLLFLGVLYVVFGTFLGSNIPYYPLYLLLALIMWNMFARGTSTSMNSFINTSNLLSRVYFPREILPITANITSLLMMLFDLCAFAVFVVIFNFVPTSTILFLPVLLIILFILTLGVSFALSVANVYFRDVEHIWGIVLQAGFFLVPIFLTLDVYPPYIRNLLLLNPMALLLEMGHDVTLYNTVPSLHDFGYLILISFAVFGIGYAVFKKFNAKAIELL